MEWDCGNEVDPLTASLHPNQCASIGHQNSVIISHKTVPIVIPSNPSSSRNLKIKKKVRIYAENSDSEQERGEINITNLPVWVKESSVTEKRKAFTRFQSQYNKIRSRYIAHKSQGEDLYVYTPSYTFADASTDEINQWDGETLTMHLDGMRKVLEEFKWQFRAPSSIIKRAMDIAYNGNDNRTKHLRHASRRQRRLDRMMGGRVISVVGEMSSSWEDSSFSDDEDCQNEWL